VQVVHELFESARAEVRDEVNLPDAALGEVRLLGVVRQRNSAGCPSAAFVLPCDGDGDQVLHYYHHQQGAREAFESSAIRLVTREEARQELVKGSLTPGAQGALQLYLCMAGSTASASQAER
jgi:hypothetical protein